MQDAVNRMNTGTPAEIKAAYDKAIKYAKKSLPELHEYYAEKFGSIMAEDSGYWDRLLYKNNADNADYWPAINRLKIDKNIADKLRAGRGLYVESMARLEEVVYAVDLLKKRIFEVLDAKNTKTSKH